MDEREKAVLEAIKKAGKPVRPGDVAKETGIDKNEVSKIIKKLKNEGNAISPKRCFYAPSE
jgi:DNA-binding Lrp family transcriptional regulator